MTTPQTSRLIIKLEKLKLAISQRNESCYLSIFDCMRWQRARPCDVSWFNYVFKRYFLTITEHIHSVAGSAHAVPLDRIECAPTLICRSKFHDFDGAQNPRVSTFFAPGDSLDLNKSIDCSGPNLLVRWCCCLFHYKLAVHGERTRSECEKKKSKSRRHPSAIDFWCAGTTTNVSQLANLACAPSCAENKRPQAKVTMCDTRDISSIKHHIRNSFASALER